VVELSSGIRDKMASSSGSNEPENKSPQGGSQMAKVSNNPVDWLKEALSSKSAFEKYYLVTSCQLFGGLSNAAEISGLGSLNKSL